MYSSICPSSHLCTAATCLNGHVSLTPCVFLIYLTISAQQSDLVNVYRTQMSSQHRYADQSNEGQRENRNMLSQVIGTKVEIMEVVVAVYSYIST